MTSQQKPLTVIGAGAVGLSVAYYAQRAGFTVTIIDRGASGDGRCSHGNAGMIVPSHFDPLASPGMLRQGLRSLLHPSGPVRVPLRLDLSFLRWCWHFMRTARHTHVARSAPVLRDLLLESRQLFAELATRHGNTFDLQHRGVLMICATKRVLEAEQHAAEFAQSLGIEAEVLDRAGVQNRDPALQVHCAGGVYYPLDAHLQPRAYCSMLERELAARGANFRWNTDVLSLRPNGKRVTAVDSTGGVLAEGDIAVAGGAWSSELLKTAGVRLPLQAGKGYSLTMPRTSRSPSVPSMLVEARVAVTPWTNDIRFAGTMEFQGLDTRLDATRIAAMKSSILEYYPELKATYFDAAQSWCGLRPCSADGLPFVGRSARYENLSIATGHAMLGISLSPVTGRLLAEALRGERVPPAFSVLAPDRFG